MLTWLLPSLGTVDALKPVNVDPPDLHDTACGPHRKRPAAEDEDDDDAAPSGDSDQQRAFMLSDLKDSQRESLLTGNPLAAVPPVVVYVGPKRATAVPTAADDAAIPTPAKPHKKRKTAATNKTDKPATSSDAKAGNAKTGAAKAADAKHDAKPSDAKPLDAKPSDAKPSDAKPSDAKSKASTPKAGQAKSSVAKPKPAAPAQ
jgi:D-alanyl-D-alanine carboxypeptidase